MTEADERAALQRLIDARREDYAGLSRLIGRNPAYIQQYIRRGTPRRLAERDRAVLARYFGIDEAELGGPAGTPAADLIAIPRLDIGASAGSGAFPDERLVRSSFGFDPGWLRRICTGRPDQLSLVRVEGDSMAPTLGDGDEILVDAGDRRPRDGIYVLRMDDALLVKRVTLNPDSRTISIRSDNPAYPSWSDCDAAAIDIVGKVLWAGRRMV